MKEIYLQPGSFCVVHIDIDNFTCTIEADDEDGYKIVIYQGEWDVEAHTVPYTGDTVADLKTVEDFCRAFIQDYIDKLQKQLDNLKVEW
jgi:hypothetical protein